MFEHICWCTAAVSKYMLWVTKYINEDSCTIMDSGREWESLLINDKGRLHAGIAEEISKVCCDIHCPLSHNLSDFSQQIAGSNVSPSKCNSSD